MGDVHIIYCVFGSAMEAATICQKLVAERMVACANRLAPVISHYIWQGEMENKEEFPVIFKTDRLRVDDAIARIAELHSAETPAILAWPATKTHAPYADWVATRTRPKP